MQKGTQAAAKADRGPALCVPGHVEGDGSSKSYCNPPSSLQVQGEWEALSRELGSGGDARIVLRHDDALSHRIFAGSDMLLVPSMFEPCGLTQVSAVRALPTIPGTYMHKKLYRNAQKAAGCAPPDDWHVHL